MATIKKLLAGATAATREVGTGIDQLRAKRLVVLDEIARIESLPEPIEDVFAAIDRDLDAMTAKAAESIYMPALLRASPPRLENPGTDAMVGLLVAANRDAFTTILRDHVAASYEGVEVMAPAARADALATLAADLADLERAEEALIRTAERAGFAPLRREDADPDVLLLADEELI
jgi:hypothetical protein